MIGGGDPAQHAARDRAHLTPTRRAILANVAAGRPVGAGIRPIAASVRMTIGGAELSYLGCVQRGWIAGGAITASGRAVLGDGR